MTKRFVLGEKFALLSEGTYYKSQVEDICEDGSFYISWPWSNMRRLRLAEDSALSIERCAPDSVTRFDAAVIGSKKNDNVELLHIKTIGEPVRIQRRSGYRIECKVTATVADSPPGFSMEEKESLLPQLEWGHIVVIDISETGLQFESAHPYPEEQLLIFQLDLGAYDMTVDMVELQGAVRRCIPPTIKGLPHRIGVAYIDLPDPLRRKIFKYVLDAQWHKRANLDF